jgi:hypothetical protein
VDKGFSLLFVAGSGRALASWRQMPQKTEEQYVGGEFYEIVTRGLQRDGFSTGG